MLLVVDVGNTHTVIGLFENDRLKKDWRIHTEPAATEDELNILLSGLFAAESIERKQIRRTVASCVVPPMMKLLDAYCRKYLGHAPVWIEASNVRMPVLYDNPGEVGADRLVNAVAAYHLYPTSLIVIDFGTATTFDAISAKGEYIGGAIAPGIGISAEALFQRASKLPRVELFNPPATVIGKNTANSMKSGIIYGYAEMVDGMVGRMAAEMGEPAPRVIATGGLAVLIKPISRTIEQVETGLTLEGLRLLSKDLN